MITSLTTGVSGLLSNQTKIDVTGNNISNVNTTAFKRSSASFNAVLGQRLMGTGRNSGGQPPHRSTVGRGVTTGSVARSWEQGRLKTDNVSTHLGLTNDGFFVARSGDDRMITRAGNFAFNSNGELVTSGGLQVQGYGFDDNGKAVMTEVKDVKIDLEKTAPPKQTDEVEIGGNLSSTTSTGLSMTGVVEEGQSGTVPSTPLEYNINGDTVRFRYNGGGTANSTYTLEYEVNGSGTWNSVVDSTDTAIGAQDLSTGFPTNAMLDDGDLSGQDANVPIDLSGMQLSATSSTNLEKSPAASQSVKVYDAKGESHDLTMNMYRVEESSSNTGNEWVYELQDNNGTPITGGNMIFASDGQLEQINGTAVSSGGYDANFSWDMDGDGTATDMTVTFGDETNSMTQYAGSTTASFKGQNGYASGKLEGYEFTNKGILQLNYTNGNTEDLFQLALGRVDNKGGLKQEGDNMFSATEQSGSLRLGRAGEEFNVNVVSGALEQSNVDIATEFSELITAQRGYQASARVITTSDEVLQETVQLKR